MRYLVVKYYVGGQEYKAYFKLEEGEPPVNYERLASGSRGDAVQALQERLVELGYLDDKADGIFGGNTGNAIRAAQEQAGMESTGIADNEFQQYIFSSSAQPRGLGGKGTAAEGNRLRPLLYAPKAIQCAQKDARSAVQSVSRVLASRIAAFAARDLRRSGHGIG